MRFIKGLLISMCVSLLALSLLGTAWSYVGLKTLHNRDTVKGWLNDSSFYDTVVDVALDNVKTSTDQTDGDIPISDPKVQAVARKTFSPEFLRSNSENVLDGMYAWLNGDAASPQFTVDLSSAKQQLAEGIGNYAAEKAASLPTCTPDQITAEFDAFNATCLPPGVTAQAAGQQVSSQLLNNGEFLNKTKLTGDDITLEKNGRKVPLAGTNEAKAIKRSYQVAGLLPLILGLISALLIAVILFASPTKRQGLRRNGITILTSGIILGLSYFILLQIPSFINKRLDAANANERLARDIINIVCSDIRGLLLWFVILFIVGGIAMIIGSSQNKSKVSDSDKETGVPPAMPRPQADPNKPAVKPAETPNPARATTAPPLPRSQQPKKTERKIQL